MTGPYPGWGHRFLNRHLDRTGTREALREDPYAVVQINLLRSLIDQVEAACEDEQVDREVTRRIVERIVLGGVPTRAEVEYRQLLAQQTKQALSGYWPLDKVVPGRG